MATVAGQLCRVSAETSCNILRTGSCAGTALIQALPGVVSKALVLLPSLQPETVYTCTNTVQCRFAVHSHESSAVYFCMLLTGIL